MVCWTTWPAETLGLTAPKPMPYRTMVSPALARREVRPAMAPGGRTDVLSVKYAATYWVPPMLNVAGASSPGWVALTVTL